MTEEQVKQDQAREQAKAQLESIIMMIERLQHSQECDGGEDCKLTDKEIIEGINTCYKDGMMASDEDRALYHNEDDINQTLDDDPLSVEVRASWHEPGGEVKDDEYAITLCTGGPAVRITGDLNEHGEPDTARLEYQDWFTPWEEYLTTIQEGKGLLTYAQHFYFGE